MSGSIKTPGKHVKFRRVSAERDPNEDRDAKVEEAKIRKAGWCSG